MKPTIITFLLLLLCNFSIAQKGYTLNGNFPQAPNKEIVLKAFTMLGDSLLSKTTADAMGKFSINYPARYRGSSLLEIKDTKSVIVLLNKENIEINWDNFEDYKSLTYKSSPENTAFVNGIAVTQKVEQLVSALNFINPIYEQELPSSPKKING